MSKTSVRISAPPTLPIEERMVFLDGFIATGRELGGEVTVLGGEEGGNIVVIFPSDIPDRFKDLSRIASKNYNYNCCSRPVPLHAD